VAMLGLDFVNLPSLMIHSASQLPERRMLSARIPPPASVQETPALAHLCVDGRKVHWRDKRLRPTELSGAAAVAGQSFLSRPKEMAAPKGDHYESNRVQLPAEDCHLVDVCGYRST
jgi:hypothetical protein